MDTGSNRPDVIIIGAGISGEYFISNYTRIPLWYVITYSCIAQAWVLTCHTDEKKGKSEGFDSCDRPSNLTQIGLKSTIFRPCDLEIWWMTSKNNKACLLYNIKLCVSFHIHQWIQTVVTVRKHPIWVKLDDFFSCVTLQFDVWPWKTIGHLSYATSSLVHHFVAIGELKLELQSGNARFGSYSTIFRAVWPWNLTDDLEK